MIVMKISVKSLQQRMQEHIQELSWEPAFQRGVEQQKYALDAQDQPAVKIAIGNMPLEYDLWQGLRNPATLGRYPVGLQELWEFYAHRRKKRVDEYGRQTIFQVPREFSFAQKQYQRTVIISVMLPFATDLVTQYINHVSQQTGSSHTYTRMYEDVNAMLDRSIGNLAIDLVDKDRAVLAMDNATVKAVSEEAVPQTHQGASHGPSKQVNYPQKSIAILTGLGQFGISRIVFRDELVNRKVERFIGPLRSIVLFDKEDVTTGGHDDVRYPTQAWRAFLGQLTDYRITDAAINKYRFCTYIPFNDEGCGKCLTCCPSQAQPNSAPFPTGTYSDHIKAQAHRFWDGQLQFDYGRCCEDRGQMRNLLPEWSCSRCVSICQAEGVRRRYAAEHYYTKMQDLTTNNNA
jgi:hypothetical protein